jgi:hypothetical protein
MKSLFFVLSFAVCSSAFAQTTSSDCDVITLKTGDVINAKIVKISEEEIDYLNCGSELPTRSVRKKAVASIKYANGITEMTLGSATITPSDDDTRIKARPARHYLGLSYRGGIDYASSTSALGTAIGLDYDVLFPRTRIGLSTSFYFRNNQLNAGSRAITLSGNGVALGLVFIIPYSKNKDNASGFAIKPRWHLAVDRMTGGSFLYATGQSGDYPSNYAIGKIYADELVIAGNSLSLDLETKFQLGRNMYLSFGGNAQYGDVSSGFWGRMDITEYRYGYVVKQTTEPFSSSGGSGPYVALQGSIGLGVVLRGKPKYQK